MRTGKYKIHAVKMIGLRMSETMAESPDETSAREVARALKQDGYAVKVTVWETSAEAYTELMLN